MTVFVQSGRGAESLPTPLEATGHTRLSTSAEISTYLERLARAHPEARIETFGTTVQGRPLQALLLSNVPDADVSTSNRLTIQIVGCQHGTESAGTESLLVIARDLLAGKLRPVLKDIDIVLIPNANPDGRETGKRANANRVNLNIDFVTLSQPESRALVATLRRFRPEVVLDIHESAVLKRKSLAREGYMTDFSTQFELANNSSIVPALRKCALIEVLLPWIAEVNASGLASQRYIGEIRSSRQPITNGGLTLNNFRNRAGIEGGLSFLMETRLDPRDGDYPTFRNIGARVEMQRICVERFITLLHEKRSVVPAAVAAARQQANSVPLVLDAQYAPALGNPRVAINLRRIADGKLERIKFADHRSILTADPMSMPAAYIIRAHQTELRTLLDRHAITCRILDAPRTDWMVGFDILPAAVTANETLDNVRERVAHARTLPGDLWIDLAQPRGRLAAALLEPRSTSSVWRKPEFFALISSEKTLPVYRVSALNGKRAGPAR